MTRMMMGCFSVAVSAAAAFGASTAHAQVVVTGTVETVPVVVTAPQQVLTVQPVVVVPAGYYVDRPRIRFGVDGSFGYAYGSSPLGRADGVGLGWGLRIGAQFNNSFAVYYQPNLTLGFVGGRASDGARDYGGVSGQLTNSLIAELNVADVWSIGLGPSFDYTVSQSCANNGTTQQCFDAPGVFPGGHFRTALLLGRRFTRRRAGFSLSFDLHPTVVWDRAGNMGSNLTALFGLGFEMY